MANRIKTLAKIFNAELNIDLFEKRFIVEWSTLASLGRLMKIARTHCCAVPQRKTIAPQLQPSDQ
ncbi:hypothetical protein [Pseudomonas sp. 18058]|uniref:hypothetical protein n=1 Tax=Pseudomonas sp. 18058 TaxID=2681406 RepID=UPI00135C8B02|nr:hypothetical protein [Pseudomonas sp. 18058]